MASYPSSAKTFATRSNGSAIDAAHINDLQDEVTAVEQGLLSGIAHALKPLTTNLYDLGTSLLKFRTLYLSGDLSVGGNGGVSGTLAVTGATTLTGGQTGATVYNSVDGSSLASLTTGNNNNVTLPSTSTIVYLSGTGTPSLTGMTAGVMGRRVTLLNVGAVTVSITHEDTNSTAANRFACPGQSTVSVRRNGGVDAIYQTTSSRWCIVGI